jgi:Predicted deacylase
MTVWTEKQKNTTLILGVVVLFIVVITCAWIIIFRPNIPSEITAPETSATPTAPVLEQKVNQTISDIGLSVEGRVIQSYHFSWIHEEVGTKTLATLPSVATTSQRILIIGGIHGGYEWNTAILAWQLINYLEQNPNILPKNISVSIVPNLNPDALFPVILKEGRLSLTDLPEMGLEEQKKYRFNKNEVDLNRNFACNWNEISSWQGRKVSGGTEAFSEPESKAIRDYILSWQPNAVLVLHSASGLIYASACNGEIMPETSEIMNLYADTVNYGKQDEFDSYAISGAIEDWLASIQIPALTVELKNHIDVEWETHLQAFLKIFEYYSQK